MSSVILDKVSNFSTFNFFSIKYKQLSFYFCGSFNAVLKFFDLKFPLRGRCIFLPLHVGSVIPSTEVTLCQFPGLVLKKIYQFHLVRLDYLSQNLSFMGEEAQRISVCKC